MNINNEQLHEELSNNHESDLQTASTSESNATEKRTRPSAKKTTVTKKVVSKNSIRSNDAQSGVPMSNDESLSQQTPKSSIKKTAKTQHSDTQIEKETVAKSASKSDRAKKSSKDDTAHISETSKQDEPSALVAKKSAKKSSAKSTKASAEPPSIEELTAFITSLKSSAKSTTSSDDDYDNEEGFSDESHLQADEDKRSNIAGDDEMVQLADGRPISRREQRRLQWLDKRRQLIELKKQERLSKKQQRTESTIDNDGLDDNTPSTSVTGASQTKSTPPLTPQSKSNQNTREQSAQISALKGNEKHVHNRQDKTQTRQESQPSDKRNTPDKNVPKGQAQQSKNLPLKSEQNKSSEAQQKSNTQPQAKPQPQVKPQPQAKPQPRLENAPANAQKQHNIPQATAPQTEQRTLPQSPKQSESKGAKSKSQPNSKLEQIPKTKPREADDKHPQQQSQTAKPDTKKDTAKQLPKKGKQPTRPSQQDTMDSLDEQIVHTKIPPKRFYMPKRLANVPLVSDEVHAIVERVENFMVNELLVDDGASILIAVSGGVDSVVLLDILSIISYERGYLLNVVHVNHQLRGDDSKRDERHVRALADRYHLGCHSTSVNVKEFASRHSLSIEEAARELRYKFFRQTSGTVRAGYCATAHHADDSAETLLMNLFRGTGLTGLAGIPPRRLLMKKTTLVRPLLCLSKSEILEYAKLRNLEWYDDDTNTIATFTRNKVRHDLIPKIKEEFNPNIVATLSRTASLLRRADGFIDSLIDSTYSDITTESDNKISIDVHKFSVLHEFLQGELAERAVAWLTTGKPVSLSAIDRIISLTDKAPGTKETLYQNVIALRERDSIVLMYENHVQEIYLSIYKLGVFHIGKYTITLDEVTRNDVRIGESKNVEYVDYDKLPYRLTLRTWHPGDTFHPIGMKGHSKVSDYLTNAKVENSERSNTVVVTTTTDIVWLVGHRLSDDFKLTNETRRIVRMSVIEDREEISETSAS